MRCQALMDVLLFFYKQIPTYEIENDFKIGDKFLRFEVFHDYEIEIEDNKLERKFFIPYVFDKGKKAKKSL